MRLQVGRSRDERSSSSDFRPPMTAASKGRDVNRRLVRSIPGALVVAVLCLGVAPGSVLRASRAEAVDATPECSTSQVQFAYFGESGAAGTAVTEIVATDASSRACVLRGYPGVRFFGGSTADLRAMTVKISHTGPGIAFRRDPERMLLEPASYAAVVITTADFSPDGSGTCPQVTSIEIGLTATGRMTRVPLWYPANICGTTASANVSSFFSESPEMYAMPAIAPICVASELAITASPAGAGLGHVGLVLHFRDSGLIPCRISGYPTVVLVGASRARILTATETPFGYLGGLAPGTGPPPVVTLEPGGYASSLLEGVDFAVNNQGACRAVTSLLVTPPFSAQSVGVATRFGGCSDVEVHPILSGTTGRRTN
jgi:hypothetical protein